MAGIFCLLAQGRPSYTNEDIATASVLKIKPLTGFPDGEEGYALGVSACFSGTLGGQLVMAGGCNFPEEGKKRYYSGIYMARVSEDTLQWRKVGQLPTALAYGCTLAVGDSLLLLGGCDTERSYATVISLRYDAQADTMMVRPLPSMPCSADNMSAAVCGDSLYVLGGNQDGTPSRSVLVRDLTGNEMWHMVSPMPGSPRVQPVCAVLGHTLYVWGGFWMNGDSSCVQTDGLAYDAQTSSWTPLPAPCDAQGEPVTLSGGVAISGLWEDVPCVLGMGGVDRHVFLDAISGRYALVDKASYLSQPVAWYRFNPLLLCFDVVSRRWKSPQMSSPYLARAGAQAVAIGTDLYYIGGELKPGVRTAEIVRISCRVP